MTPSRYEQPNGPELVLRFWAIGKPPKELRLAAGFTIGGSVGSRYRATDAGAPDAIAKVEAADDGLTLRALAPDWPLIVADGRRVDWLPLVDQTLFNLGPLLIGCACLRREAREAAWREAAQPAAGVPAAALPDLECPACQQPFDVLPRTARFCPRCGLARALAGPPVPVLPDDAACRASLEALKTSIRDHLDGSLDTPALAETRSMILMGYANALLHLGWRYERGRGVARSLPEAERCYEKSAKLGQIERGDG